MNASSARDTADFNDLVRSIVLAHTTTGEYQEYFLKLREALLATLTADPTARRSSDATALDSLLGQALTLLSQNLDPFAGFLEAPRTVVDLYQKHAQPIRDSAAQWQRSLDALVRDLIAIRWPETRNAVVAWEALADRGVPRQPPVVSDPLDDI